MDMDGACKVAVLLGKSHVLPCKLCFYCFILLHLCFLNFVRCLGEMAGYINLPHKNIWEDYRAYHNAIVFNNILDPLVNFKNSGIDWRFSLNPALSGIWLDGLNSLIQDYQRELHKIFWILQFTIPHQFLKISIE